MAGLEKLVSTIKALCMSPNEKERGVRRGKSSLLVCRIRRKCYSKTPRNSAKVKSDLKWYMQLS